MTTETLAAFARRLGFDRSRITQLAGQGRVALTPDGKLIEVEASLARMAATADPGRMDVVERHAGARTTCDGLVTDAMANANDHGGRQAGFKGGDACK